MLKFTSASKDGKTTLIGLGISEMNVQKLKEGLPIIVKGSEIGQEGIEIFLFYGKDEIVMKNMLKEMVGKETQVKDTYSGHL